MTRIKRAYTLWRDHLSRAVAEKSVYGAEKAIIVSCFFLQALSLYSWLFRVFTPEEDRPRRLVSEAYTILWLVIMILLLIFVRAIPTIAVVAAAYYTVELTVNVFAIFFGGKLEFREPTSSVERSLIYFIVNLFQMIVTFAIFYIQLAPEWSPLEAFEKSVLLFATVQNPIEGLKPRSVAVFLVATQVAVNFIFFVILMAAFVGKLRALERVQRKPQPSPLPIEPLGL